MVDFGEFLPNIDIENIIKLDQESITKALVGGTFTYVGAGSIIDNKTPEQVKDIIDDVITAKLGRPLGEMIGNGMVPDIIGLGAMSYFEIGDSIADAVVKTEVVGEETVLTSGSKSAAKLVLATVVGGSQLINFNALGGN